MKAIGVTRDGNARAYPLRVLDRHEITIETETRTEKCSGYIVCSRF